MSTASDLGLLIIRAGTGAALAGHGAQKLLGWFGGGGVKGTGNFFESGGFVPGPRNAVLAGLAEAGGGLLLALGLGTGAAGAAIAGTMAVASATHVQNGFFAMGGGYELSAVYGLVGAALALGEPGRFSLDARTGDALNRPWMRVAALVTTTAAAVYLLNERAKVLADRREAEQPSEA